MARGFSLSAILVETLFASQEPLETVTDMNPSYPQAAEVADAHLTTAVEGLRGDMRTSFDRVERRLENMVTQEAFRSEISRLDQKDTHLEDKISEGFAAIAARDEKRDAAAEKRDEDRDKKFARRMTWTLTGVGLAFGFYTTFIAPFLQHLLK